MKFWLKAIFDFLQNNIRENPYGTSAGQVPVSLVDDLILRKFYEGGQACALGSGNQLLTAGVPSALITKTLPTSKILISPVLTVSAITTGPPVSVEFKVFSGISGEVEQMVNVQSGNSVQLPYVIGIGGYIKYTSLTAGSGVYVAVTISGMLING